jgi:hypothetical protein
MDFEEMKVIWDTQNAEPLYAVNEQALRQSVRRKTRRLNRLIVFFEAAVIAGTVGLSAFYIAIPLLRGQQYERFVSAAILLGAAAYFFAGIAHRRRREAEFEPSLLGDIDKALWQVRHHVSRARGIRWSILVPFCVAMVIDWIFPLGESRKGWLVLLTLLLMALTAWGVEYEIRSCYLPKERRLEALRKMLVDSEP